MGLRDNRVFRLIAKIIDLYKRNFVIGTFLIIIFLIVGSFVGYKTTRWMETPQFCAIAICHKSMYPYGVAWEQSAHAQRNLGFKCMECHAEVRLGPVQTKYFGTLLSHGLDGPPLMLAVIQGKIPPTEFDPLLPTIQSERCLRCHAPDANIPEAFPVTAEDHSRPIDVSEMFEWTIENPRGTKYVCKNCHPFIAHPTDTENLPTERGEKYEYTHPGFPKIDFGPWQQTHLHLLRDGGKDGKEFVYSGESHETSFKITADEIEINGVERKLDTSMCKICHKIERLRPENMDGKCQGCHNHGEITLFEHHPIPHLPNPNDYFGTKGIVGGPRKVATKPMKIGLFFLGLVMVALFSAVLAVVDHATTTNPEQLIDFRGVKVCYECHDPAQTIGFHYPDKIMEIEEEKGLRRRICVDCHGPDGADPDRQMTTSREVVFVEEGNYFKVKSDVVHAIHLEKIETEVMVCETCHLIKEGDPTQLGEAIIIPEPKSGHVLVCQMCHLPSDPGNYVTIHITSGHQDCNTCHTGDLAEMHKRATTKLG
jgi:hypothetical protein